MVGGSGERRHEKRPAMGESWRNQPHARVQLARPPPGADGAAAPERCTATLRASGLQPLGESVQYALSEAGLAPAVPPTAPGGWAGGGGQQPMQLH